MSKKPCAIETAVVEPRNPHRSRTPKRVTPDAHTPPETAICVMIKVLSVLAPSHISKTPEKASATLTKVLTALVPPGSSKKKTVAPKVTRTSRPQKNSLPDDLGKCISRDAAAVSHLGWEEFFWRRRCRGDFAGLEKLRHPSRRMIRQYKFQGAPVVLAGKGWTKDQRV